MNQLFRNIDLTTLSFTIAIVIATCVAALYIWTQNRKGLLTNKRRWIEQLPSLISTLGVLGTFYGITIGLLKFDTAMLDASIPKLLDGMKTAFFTSLAGMIGSLLLSRMVARIFDEKDGGISDINMAAGEIVKAVQAMSEANRSTLNELKEQAEQQAKDQAAFHITVGNALASIVSDSGRIPSLLIQTQSVSTSLDNAVQKLDNVESATAQITLSVGNIEEFTEKQKESLVQINTKTSNMDAKVTEMSTNVGEIVDTISSISTIDEEISAEVKAFGGKLHNEVVEIEDKMDETNNLLTRKFDEFTELLKKSNTEALVEVMKKVTEEFQKQMNALINKLIQENFEQLNKSVERLNTWQQENKEMIVSLTMQYKQMADNFASTSTTLTKVGNDTQSLVSDGGKLKQLIETLNKVIIEDSKFVQVSANLTETATLAKSNMEKFDESTTKLNEWVRKQRNFVDGVTALIEKLDELNKLRDYGEQFWQSTKEKMEEGVSIVSKGTMTLNTQLRSLDQQFYARLSATLAELDTCIQAMVNDRR